MKIMHVLHKLILNEQDGWRGKQDVHLWKETALFYLIMDLQQGN